MSLPSDQTGVPETCPDVDKRLAMLDTARKHVKTAWADGRQWTCVCPDCTFARGYNPNFGVRQSAPGGRWT